MRPVTFVIYPLLFATVGLAGGPLVSEAISAPRWNLAGVSPAGLGPAAVVGGAQRSEPAGAAAPGRALEGLRRPYRWFPASYFPSERGLFPVEMTGLFDRAAWERARADRENRLPLLAGNTILAFYGHPLSRRMGILGEYPKEELSRLLKGYARLYDEANGPSGVIPAFYLIYGTCWPEGEIGYLKESTVIEYIEFAAREGMLVFLDHQIGKFGVEAAMRRLLPFLKYPNVHLALDPEWSTLAPMEEIGWIDAEDLNRAQAMLQDYLEAEGLPGIRILVVHQFMGKMIANRERARADFERVLLVHTADGFGPPELKRDAYEKNALAVNMPLKGFKLFLKTSQPGAGYDDPLLTPPEVLALDPPPSLVIYQ
jgi:hypothetical protein